MESMNHSKAEGIDILSSDNKTTIASEKRRVSFLHVEIREYELELSDHPACSLGPAIAIGWGYELTSKESIDDFETNRPAKRSMAEMKLPRKMRETIMENSKFTKKEIQKTLWDKAKLKDRRQSTNANLPFSHLEERWEKARRKLKRIVRLQQKDAELLKLWPEYAQYSKSYKDTCSLSTASPSSSSSEESYLQ